MSDVHNKYLIFAVDEEYALPLSTVVEIIEHREITRVPETPDYVAGIINLRGHVIPVIDIRTRFRKESKAMGKRRCIIITRIEGKPLGLVVDTVIDLIDIREDQINEVPQVGKNYVHIYIKGIGISEKRMHLIVDTDKLVNYNELGFLEEENLEGQEPVKA